MIMIKLYGWPNVWSAMAKGQQYWLKLCNCPTWWPTKRSCKSIVLPTMYQRLGKRWQSSVGQRRKRHWANTLLLIGYVIDWSLTFNIWSDIKYNRRLSI
jgi:hypothetical protein